jgi:hypothetical protein
MRTRLSAEEASVLSVLWRVTRERPAVFARAAAVFSEAECESERRALLRCASKGWLEWDGSLFEPAYRVVPAIALRLHDTQARPQRNPTIPRTRRGKRTMKTQTYVGLPAPSRPHTRGDIGRREAA